MVPVTQRARVSLLTGCCHTGPGAQRGPQSPYLSSLDATSRPRGASLQLRCLRASLPTRGRPPPPSPIAVQRVGPAGCGQRPQGRHRASPQAPRCKGCVSQGPRRACAGEARLEGGGGTTVQADVPRPAMGGLVTPEGRGRRRKGRQAGAPSSSGHGGPFGSTRPSADRTRPARMQRTPAALSLRWKRSPVHTPSHLGPGWHGWPGRCHLRGPRAWGGGALMQPHPAHPGPWRPWGPGQDASLWAAAVLVRPRAQACPDNGPLDSHTSEPPHRGPP